MSRLLSRARVALDNAEYDYHKVSVDDCYIDACCYNLQQSIEMSLKFIVEMYGESYAENHDIRANLNKLHALGIDIPGERRLRAMASTLYGWETESRYRESFEAALADIEEAFVLARKLIKFAEGFLTEIEADSQHLSEFPAGRLDG